MERSARSSPRTRRGFTLVEAIGAIAVLAAIGSIASVTVVNAVDSYLDVATGAQLHSEASLALERMVTELRAVERDTGAAGIAPNISSVTPSSIEWNDDSSLSLVGDQIILVENGGAAAVLLDDVSAFSVAAYDESNAALAASLAGAACDAIRRLELQAAVSRSGASAAVRTRVFLRSTMAGGS